MCKKASQLDEIKGGYRFMDFSPQLDKYNWIFDQNWFKLSFKAAGV